MKRNVEGESKWIAVLRLLGALLIGAFIGTHASQPVIAETDWIETIQSADAN